MSGPLALPPRHDWKTASRGPAWFPETAGFDPATYMVTYMVMAGQKNLGIVEVPDGGSLAEKAAQRRKVAGRRTSIASPLVLNYDLAHKSKRSD